MLTWLKIQHFAIADHIELELSNGLNVMTGETGAGKSIMINALGLVLGARAEANVIKHGHQRAEIQADFDISGQASTQALLQSLALDDENECQLRRVIRLDAPSKAFVNGRMVTLSVLRKIGENLVDIHGQNEHQSLLRSETQRELLDDYAGIGDKVKQLGERYHAFHKAQNNLLKLRSDSAAASEKLAFLQYQIDELQSFAPLENEWQDLHAQHQRIHHQADLLAALQQAETALYGDINSGNDNEKNASAQISAGIAALDKVQNLEPRLAALLQTLSETQTLIQESEANMREVKENIHLDKAELEQIEQRYAAYMSFSRKHRIAPEQLFAMYQDLLTQLSLAEDPQASESKLSKQLQTLSTQYQTLAETISRKRKTAASKLGKQISHAMKDLAMQGGQCNLELQSIKPHKTHQNDLPTIGSETGNERINFLVSTNKGMPAQALVKIASGGELSRISLAIQVIFSNLARVNTLVFDEVDVGVGGKTAAMIGKMLAALAKNKQIICITHLPQVAAYGKQHYRVEKAQGKQVQLSIAALNESEKVNEIARMVGGETATKESLAHASSLISASQ